MRLLERDVAHDLLSKVGYTVTFDEDSMYSVHSDNFVRQHSLISGKVEEGAVEYLRVLEQDRREAIANKLHDLNQNHTLKG